MEEHFSDQGLHRDPCERRAPDIYCELSERKYDKETEKSETSIFFN
jgi:hypothetical protein